jgi:hypothetical protein
MDDPQFAAQFREFAAEEQAASILTPLSSFREESPRYFWNPYIRAGNLNIIRGDGGSGKTALAFALAAAVTTGHMPAQMPGSMPGTDHPATVIYFGAEDDPGEYRFRANNAGCDCGRLYIVTPGAALPTMGSVDRLRLLIRYSKARLIIFDPVQSFLGAKVDINKANEIRPVLDALRELMRSEDCACVIIEHLNKASGQNAHYRGIGSVDFINASRSVLLVGRHPVRMDSRAVFHLKANALYGEPFSFTMDTEGRFVWEGQCAEVDCADDVLGSRRSGGAAIQPAEVVTPDMPLIRVLQAMLDEHPDGLKVTASEIFNVMTASEGGLGETDSPTKVGAYMQRNAQEMLSQAGISVKKGRNGNSVIWNVSSQRQG